jgi:RNA polymerase subunit RPABC4/transcription elongation factor Spt4
MPSEDWKPDHVCVDCRSVTYTGPGNCPYCGGTLQERN